MKNDKTTDTAIFFKLDETTAENLDELIYWFKKNDKNFPKSRAAVMRFLVDKFLSDVGNLGINFPTTDTPTDSDKVTEFLQKCPLVKATGE
jgi:hypothetical protein